MDALYLLGHLYVLAVLVFMLVRERTNERQMRDVIADAEQCRDILIGARLNPPRRQVNVPPRPLPPRLPPRCREF